MSLNAVTHLNFHGQARAALEFYRSVFGGQTTIATYADFGMPAKRPTPPKSCSARSSPATVSG